MRWTENPENKVRILEFPHLVSMNAPLYPNRRRVSGLSEDGKTDRVVDKKGMGKSEMSPREYLSRWISTKSCGS